ncbi:hypothetical protein D3C75_850260 [compost metagenome]
MVPVLHRHRAVDVSGGGQGQIMGPGIAGLTVELHAVELMGKYIIVLDGHRRGPIGKIGIVGKPNRRPDALGADLGDHLQMILGEHMKTVHNQHQVGTELGSQAVQIPGIACIRLADQGGQRLLHSPVDGFESLPDVQHPQRQNRVNRRTDGLQDALAAPGPVTVGPPGGITGFIAQGGLPGFTPPVSYAHVYPPASFRCTGTDGPSSNPASRQAWSGTPEPEAQLLFWCSGASCPGGSGRRAQ